MPAALPLYPENPFSPGGGGQSPYQFSYLDPLEAAQSIDTSNIGEQQNALNARIPNAAGLEQLSSNDIASLLNPPAMFTDTSREAAELGAGRGIGGSAASFGVGLRMTDDERLRRIALGENLLSGADARNPAAQITNPLSLIALQQQIYNQNRQPIGPTGAPARITSSGPQPNTTLPPVNPNMGGSPNFLSSTSGTGYGSTSTWSSGGTYPNPSGDLLPLYPGGPTPGGSNSGLDAILRDLGLTPPDYNPGQDVSNPTPYTPVGDIPGTGDGEDDNYYGD